jgi:integrase
MLPAADPRTVVGERAGGVLYDLLRLGLMSGARLNELCELKAGDVLVEIRAIIICKGKTLPTPDTCAIMNRR